MSMTIIKAASANRGRQLLVAQTTPQWRATPQLRAGMITKQLLNVQATLYYALLYKDWLKCQQLCALACMFCKCSVVKATSARVKDSYFHEAECWRLLMARANIDKTQHCQWKAGTEQTTVYKAHNWLLIKSLLPV